MTTSKALKSAFPPPKYAAEGGNDHVKGFEICCGEIGNVLDKRVLCRGIWVRASANCGDFMRTVDCFLDDEFSRFSGSTDDCDTHVFLSWNSLEYSLVCSKA